MPKPYSNWKQQIKQEEVPPPPEAWEAISNELHPKKKAKIIFFWTRVAVILIPVLVGIGAWWWSKTPSYTQKAPQKTDLVLPEKQVFQDSTEELENTKIASQNEEKFNDNQSFQAKDSEEVKQPTSYVNSFNKEKKATEILLNTIPQKESNRFSSVVAKKEKSIEERVTNIPATEQQTNEYSPALNTETEDETIEMASLLPNDEKDTEEQIIHEKQNKIRISPYAGWVHLSSSERMINDKLSDLENKATPSFSYGAKASYALSSQWRITTGVGQMNFHHTTYNVPITSTLIAGVHQENIRSTSYLQIDLPIGGQYNSVSSLDKETNIITSQEKSVSQEIRFIEIPLEVEYQVLQEKKWNVSFATGVSTLLLQKNRLYVDQDGANTVFARPTDYSQVSFSANGAVKAEYQLNPYLSLQVEPQIKYFLNSLREQNNLTPYIWGVSTGISFHF